MNTSRTGASQRADDVLTALASGPGCEWFFLDLVGVTGLSSGNLAVIVNGYERRGWVESGWEHIATDTVGQPRRYYRLSSEGRSVAHNAGLDIPALFGEQARTRLTPSARNTPVDGDKRAAFAAALCDLAADALPSDDRERYRSEWQADVRADPVGGLRYAISLVAHVVRLRATVAGRDVKDVPWPCVLRQHRFVTIHDNRENLRSISHLCTRCGYVKDEWRGARDARADLAWGTFTRREP
ncbi:MAG: hypothetical protein M3Y26_09995 [Actinomycetota bacterium]|nr:hypothetical protein [Actinomycetota bacterium]